MTFKSRITIFEAEYVPLMSIANELSSDVATAVLARKNVETAQAKSELAGVVMKLHTTLRRLTLDARRKKRRAQATPAEEPPRSNAAASGS